MRTCLLTIFSSAAMMLLTGCASIDPGKESDMPWNTPQSWEGSPMIPGLSN